MRILLIPSNNSLSHIAKCVALKKLLQDKGGTAFIAINERRRSFLDNLEEDYFLLPDIEENDTIGFPTFDWFSKPERTVECIAKEVELIGKVKPDRVLGIFRFTARASTLLTNTPFDSFTCGCMLPDLEETLGFAGDEPDVNIQKEFMNNFYRYSAIKTNLALKTLKLNPIDDIRALLKGDRTFLWDFPEFMPMLKLKDIYHIGPVILKDWDKERTFTHCLDKSSKTAVVAFGTCTRKISVLKRIVDSVLKAGFKVCIAAGGQREILDVFKNIPNVTAQLFAPLSDVLPFASLLITHGGQFTIFDALRAKTPIIVMPLQPEQAHNGVCLERLNCGQRLISSQLYRGNPDVYENAFDKLTDSEIVSTILNVASNDQIKINLERLSEIVMKYNGLNTLCTKLLEGV